MNYPTNYSSSWHVDVFGEETLDEEVKEAAQEGLRPVKTWREDLTLYVLWSDDSMTTYPLRPLPKAKQSHMYAVARFDVRLEHLQCTIYHTMKSVGFHSPMVSKGEYLRWRDLEAVQNG